MHPSEARDLALRLMRKHGLVGWTFRFDHAKRRFGSCRPAQKLITLSRPLTLLNSVEEVRDTILHEIAHALEPTDGHGKRWRQACIRIGARPQRCFTENEVITPQRPAAACEMGCIRCDWWSDRRRLTISRYHCKYCGGTVFYREKATGRMFLITPRQQLQWVKNQVKEKAH